MDDINRELTYVYEMGYAQERRDKCGNVSWTGSPVKIRFIPACDKFQERITKRRLKQVPDFDAYLGNKELHVALKAANIDSEKFWYLILFCMDYACRITYDTPKIHYTPREEINSFIEHGKLSFRELLKSERPHIELKVGDKLLTSVDSDAAVSLILTAVQKMMEQQPQWIQSLLNEFELPATEQNYVEHPFSARNLKKRKEAWRDAESDELNCIGMTEIADTNNPKGWHMNIPNGEESALEAKHREEETYKRHRKKRGRLASDELREVCETGDRVGAAKMLYQKYGTKLSARSTHEALSMLSNWQGMLMKVNENHDETVTSSRWAREIPFQFSVLMDYFFKSVHPEVADLLSKAQLVSCYSPRQIIINLLVTLKITSKPDFNEEDYKSLMKMKKQEWGRGFYYDDEITTLSN